MNLKPIFATIAALALPLLAAAQADIKWDCFTHDFGAFDEDDGTVTCHFVFTNVGDAPLSISAVRTSCGCTTSKPPSRLILPGETDSIAVSYNPTGRPGRFDKKIYVDANAIPARTTLSIRGTVIGSSNTLRSRFPIDAGALKLRNSVVTFSDIKKGLIKHSFLDVYNASSDTLTPVWSGVPDYLRITSVSPTVPPGEVIAYSIMFDAVNKDVPYGLVTDSIFLAPAPGEPAVAVESIAMVNEDFSRLSPSDLANAPIIDLSDRNMQLGTISPYASVTRTFTIDNKGKRDLLIRRVYTVDPGVTVRIDRNRVKKGKPATVTVTVDPAKLPTDVVNAKICVISNDPENAVQNVRLTGFIEE